MSWKWFCVPALVLAAAIGCSPGGPPTAHLRGTVTIGGEPIPAEAEAVINFRATTADQASPASAQIVDGRFDVPDAPQGAVRVQFFIQMPIGEESFAPGVRPEMQFQPLVPDEHAGGILINVAGDDLNIHFDL